MIFRKKMEPSCAYCRYGYKISETEAACIKKGVIPLDSSCSKFRYDPLKREPSKPIFIDSSKYDPSDFEL